MCISARAKQQTVNRSSSVEFQLRCELAMASVTASNVTEKLALAKLQKKESISHLAISKSDALGQTAKQLFAPFVSLKAPTLTSRTINNLHQTRCAALYQLFCRNLDVVTQISL